MTFTKTASVHFSDQDISNANEYALASCYSTDCSAALIADVEGIVEYHGSAVAAATVYVYSSVDNTNWGSSPVDQFTMPFAAGAQKRWSKTIIPSAKYYKCTMRNDTGQTATATVTLTYQTGP